jgi:hypothetical protein
LGMTAVLNVMPQLLHIGIFFDIGRVVNNTSTPP